MTSAIEFYGAQWCGDCRRAKQVLDRYHVDYNHHDIESEEGAAEKAEQISRCCCSRTARCSWSRRTRS